MARKKADDRKYEGWDFQIDEWEYSYSFGIKRRQEKEIGYQESGHFTVKGAVTYPDAKRGLKARLHFIPSLEMDALITDDRHDEEGIYRPIGHFNTRKNSMTAFLNIPWHGHKHIIHMMDRGTFRFVGLHGYLDSKNGLAVQSVRFSMTDPAE